MNLTAPMIRGRSPAPAPQHVNQPPRPGLIKRMMPTFGRRTGSQPPSQAERAKPAPVNHPQRSQEQQITAMQNVRLIQPNTNFGPATVSRRSIGPCMPHTGGGARVV